MLADHLRHSIDIALKISSLIAISFAILLTGLSVEAVYEKLFSSGCIRQLFGGAKAQSSCFNNMLGTGVVLVYACAAWWVSFGTLFFAPSKPTHKPWKPILIASKYLGTATGILVLALYLIPLVFVLFAYAIVPLVFFLFACLAAMVVSVTQFIF